MGRRDPDDSVPEGTELLTAMDVSAPLPLVRTVLVTLVLDDHSELLEQQIDPADRVIIRREDEIAVRLWHAGQD